MLMGIIHKLNKFMFLLLETSMLFFLIKIITTINNVTQLANYSQLKTLSRFNYFVDVLEQKHMLAWALWL